MSRSNANTSVKRTRSGAVPGLLESESTILALIKSKKNLGVWRKDIIQETSLADPIVTKSLEFLLSKKLIKEVVNIQNRRKKHYMAVEFEASKELSGGDWYNNGELDQERIKTLRQRCLSCLTGLKVATLERIHEELKKDRVTFEISSKQVGEILNSLVLDNYIIEVKSTGLRDYLSIPIGASCFRLRSSSGKGSVRVRASGKGSASVRADALASIPCGACPRISVCTANGLISPSTCVYYTKWLNIIDF